MSGISINNRTFVGLANLALVRANDGVVLALPKPSQFVLSPGITLKEQLTRTESGQTARARTYVTGALPTLQITYNHLQLELIQFQLGNTFAAGTFAEYLPRLIAVTKSTYPAATSGFAGFGITADQTGSSASVNRNSLSFPLTQNIFANFNTWKSTADNWAVGADGALVFSDNLVANGDVVALQIPYNVTGVGLSSVVTGDFRISATLIDTENAVTFFTAYSVTADISGSAINPTADSVDLKFFVNTPPSKCIGYSLTQVPNLKIICQ